MITNIIKLIRETIEAHEHLDTNKMWSWYDSTFKKIYYQSEEEAKDNIVRRVAHNNKQYGHLFGNENADDIINLFNFVKTIRGVKVVPKIKQPKPRKVYTYETSSELVAQQKNIWTFNHGIELGRYLSSTKSIRTKDKRIGATESTDEQNVLNIMKKLKNGDDLPPILLDSNFAILDGHHRWEAAKRLRIKYIPVIFYMESGD